MSSLKLHNLSDSARENLLKLPNSAKEELLKLIVEKKLSSKEIEQITSCYMKYGVFYISDLDWTAKEDSDSDSEEEEESQDGCTTVSAITDPSMRASPVLVESEIPSMTASHVESEVEEALSRYASCLNELSESKKEKKAIGKNNTSHHRNASKKLAQAVTVLRALHERVYSQEIQDILNSLEILKNRRSNRKAVVDDGNKCVSVVLPIQSPSNICDVGVADNGNNHVFTVPSKIDGVTDNENNHVFTVPSKIDGVADNGNNHAFTVPSKVDDIEIPVHIKCVVVFVVVILLILIWT